MPMSSLEEEFYERYERPIVEPYVVGFSGIDPPLKSSGGNVGSTDDHERLSGLLGGDNTGHYHLTPEEYELFLVIGKYYVQMITGS